MINTPDKSIAQSSRSPSIGEDEKKASEDDKKGIATEEITSVQSLPKNPPQQTEEDELNPPIIMYLCNLPIVLFVVAGSGSRSKS